MTKFWLQSAQVYLKRADCIELLDHWGCITTTNNVANFILPATNIQCEMRLSPWLFSSKVRTLSVASPIESLVARLTFHRVFISLLYTEGKVFPLQASAGPWGSGRLRLPDFLDFGHYEGGKVVTLTHRPSLPPGVFLVLISIGWVDPREHGSVGSFGKNPHWHHSESIPRPSDW